MLIPLVKESVMLLIDLEGLKEWNEGNCFLTFLPSKLDKRIEILATGVMLFEVEISNEKKEGEEVIRKTLFHAQGVAYETFLKIGVMLGMLPCPFDPKNTPSRTIVFRRYV